jgi:hypothetical protein
MFFLNLEKSLNIIVLIGTLFLFAKSRISKLQRTFFIAGRPSGENRPLPDHQG